MLTIETTNTISDYATQRTGAYYSQHVQNSAADQALDALTEVGALDNHGDYINPVNWRDVIDMLALCGGFDEVPGIIYFLDNSYLAFDPEGVGRCNNY